MEYGMLLMFLVFAVVFVAAAFIVNAILMPHHPTYAKNSTYECGVDPIGEAHVRYNLRFYVFALMYVVFAVESVFLIPWAVVYRSLSGLMPLIEILIFLFIIILGLAYAWKKGELKWD